MRLVRGRLAAISVRTAFGAGVWVGGALGLVIGAILGAVVVWLCGAVLDWQRELGFTLGIARSLLPFGDQVGALSWINAAWWLVIPAVAVAGAVVSGLIGGLIGGLLAGAYNRSPRRASVVMELSDEVGLGEAAEDASAGDATGHSS